MRIPHPKSTPLTCLLCAGLMWTSAWTGAGPEPAEAQQTKHGHEKPHGHAHEPGHTHGLAHLVVRRADHTLTTRMTAPGGTFFGDTPRESRTPAEALKQAIQAPFYFTLPDAALCSVEGRAFKIQEIAEGDHAGHKDVIVSVTHRCENPDALTRIEVTSFDTMPKLDALNVTYMAHGYGLRVRMTPDAHAMRLDSPLIRD